MIDTPETPEESTARLNKALTNYRTPQERWLDEELIYSADGRLLGLTDIVTWVQQAGRTTEERLAAAKRQYEQVLYEDSIYFEERYKHELQKEDDRNIDLMLLLKQHLQDIHSGCHAITAQYRVLTNYILYGEHYADEYKYPPVTLGSNRFAESPDGNLVLYASGYLSDWKSAAREAYSTVYKLGYDLEDIYIFNYKRGDIIPDSPFKETPLPLSQIMDFSGRFIGDFKVLFELEKAILTAAEAEIDEEYIMPDWINYRDELLSKSPLQEWCFSSHDNLYSPEGLQGDAESYQKQLTYLCREYLASGRKINLLASSQGAAVTVGCLLLPDKAGNPLFNPVLQAFVQKYAFTISSHGGAFLAQAADMADRRNFLIDIVEKLAAQFIAPKTFDLAIDSSYTQATYAALTNAEVTTRLQNLRGIEVYACNDDITTSFPLATLPVTREVRMVTGRHEEIIVGIGEASGNKSNKYVYNFLKGNSYKLDLKSDLLIYSGYLKRGLPDINLLDKAGIALPFINANQLTQILLGKAGVIDYPVRLAVYQDVAQQLDAAKKEWKKLELADKLDLAKKAVWFKLDFGVFERAEKENSRAES